MEKKKLTAKAEKQKRRAEIAEAKLAATVAHVEELKQERKEAVVLTEKEAHCIARLLQGAVFGKNGSVFDGCAFCKFQCNMDGEKGDIAPHYDEIIRKLWEATGVDLGPGHSTPLLHTNFPHKKFLKNSNEDIKEYFRNFFKDV